MPQEGTSGNMIGETPAVQCAPPAASVGYRDVPLLRMKVCSVIGAPH